MKIIEINQLILFHKKIVQATGGSDGIRDITLIESALNKAFATFDGIDLYEGTIRKIFVIAYSLIMNHGFVDGNKRIGISAMLLLLKLNEVTLSYTQTELVELGLKVAEGALTEEDIEQWVIRHQVSNA